MYAPKPDIAPALNRADFSEVFFTLKGQPFSFEGREWLRPIYVSNAPRKMLKTARQVGKSTHLATTVLSDSAMIDYFASLYCSPTSTQTGRFSRQRLSPLMKDSPVYRRGYWSKRCIDAVYNKTLKNRSSIVLGSAFHDADGMRGESADRLCVDEIQDIHSSSINVLEETLFNSSYDYRLYAGTPKTTAHATDYYYNASTQNEWGVRCSHCNLWNLPLGEDNMHPEYLACASCGKDITGDVIENGEWITKHYDAPFEGWHISQLMCTWKPWHTIYEKYHGPTSLPAALFYNEVLGFSFDTGTKPITDDDIIPNCVSTYSIINNEDPIFLSQCPTVTFAGLDWAVQSPDLSEAPSYTVFVVLGMEQGRLRVIDIKKYLGYESDPDHVLKDIYRRLKLFGVSILGCDWGGGHKENRRIAKTIGDESVMEFRYTGQGEKLVIDHKRISYNLNRTMVLDDVFHLITTQGYMFPKWEEFSPYAADITCTFTDYGNRFNRELRYDKPRNLPDDFLHALTFGTLAARWYHGQLYAEDEVFD